MRKVILYIALSLDGFIADAQGGVGWLGGEQPQQEGDNGYGEFIRNVDTIIIGKKTYDQIATELFPDRWYYEGKLSYILTHHPQKDTNEIKFTNEPAADLVERLRRQEGKNIWICGGAQVVNDLMRADLIDEYHLTWIPTMLGSGVRLFDASRKTVLLHLAECTNENGMVDCTYVRRQQR